MAAGDSTRLGVNLLEASALGNKHVALEMLLLQIQNDHSVW